MKIWNDALETIWTKFNLITLIILFYYKFK